MEPIISPWIIYAISVCSKLTLVCACVCAGSAVAFLISLGISPKDWCYIDSEETFDKVNNKIQSCRKIAIKLFVIFGLIGIIIPNERTLYAMVAVSLITPDNINLVEGNIVDFITKIIDACNRK